MGKTEEKVIDVQAEEVQEQEAPKVHAELIVRVYEDGNMEVNVPDGARELSSMEVEMITRSVYDQLHDSRVAAQAVEMFKSKLG